MPGKHKEPTIAFRPSAWARAIIEQRAALSGIYKKDFITRSCVYSNIVVVGKKENIQRIVDIVDGVEYLFDRAPCGTQKLESRAGIRTVPPCFRH